MDALFRQSKLYRDKWDERRGSETYGERTIAAACASCTEYYTPSHSSTKTRKGKNNQEGKEEKFKFKAAFIAARITEEDHFAKDEGDLLYCYDKGAYWPTAKDVIKANFQKLCNELGCADQWTSHMSREVIEYITVNAPRLWSTPPLETLNVQNGLLDVASRTIQPHNAEFLSPVQLPVRFDPEALCPAWDQFIQDVFPEDSQALGYEIPAYLMLPDMSQQKAFLIIGEGENGKSTYWGGISRFLGKHNISTVSLHRLEADKFAAHRLLGKLANICPDLPSEHLTRPLKPLPAAMIWTRSVNSRIPFRSRLLPAWRLVPTNFPNPKMTPKPSFADGLSFRLTGPFPQKRRSPKSYWRIA